VATQIYPIGNRHELPASAAMGVVASQQGSPAANLVVLDEAGRVVRTIGEPARYGNAVVSPNGKRIAFEIFTDTDERFAMAEDLERGVRTPLSARGHLADGTAWAPDNDTVYFDSNAGGPWAIFRKAVTGGGEPESLGTPEGSIDTGLLDVSPDGQWVLCYGSTKDGKASLYLRSTAAGQEAWRQWTASSSMEEYGVFSPDSRWIAYTSDASGRVEAYIASLGDGPEVRRWQISSAGGVEPRFSPDGKKLYYRSPSFDWMVVDLTLAPGAVTAGTPTKLFSLPPIELGYMRNVMAIFPNGKEFLNVRSVAETSSMIRVKIGR
jgi:WD40 repeat protein